MATLAQHIAAKNDHDLLPRLIAAAEVAGIPAAQQWVEQRVGQLVSADVAEGQSVADVHAYAVASYAPTPRPGADDTKITDAHISAAVAAVQAADDPAV